MSRTQARLRLRVGTRGSRLARAQTELVVRALQRTHPSICVETVIIQTRGDRERSRPLPQIGGKGLFTGALESALRDGQIDLAVHSLKDLPVAPRAGLCVAAIPRRADPHDVLVCRSGKGLGDLPVGAQVGTSSLRRAAQLRAVRPDLRVEPIRGNLDTRLRKLQEEGWDAIVVAAAGLERLGCTSVATEQLPLETMLPAPGQGALAVQVRAEDATLIALLREALHDERTGQAVAAERGFLQALGGGCHVPIAAFAQPQGDGWILHGLVAAPDGSRVLRGAESGTDPEALAQTLAKRLLDQGAAELLEAAAS